MVGGDTFLSIPEPFPPRQTQQNGAQEEERGGEGDYPDVHRKEARVVAAPGVQVHDAQIEAGGASGHDQSLEDNGIGGVVDPGVVWFGTHRAVSQEHGIAGAVED